MTQRHWNFQSNRKGKQKYKIKTEIGYSYRTMLLWLGLLLFSAQLGQTLARVCVLEVIRLLWPAMVRCHRGASQSVGGSRGIRLSV